MPLERFCELLKRKLCQEEVESQSRLKQERAKMRSLATDKQLAGSEGCRQFSRLMSPK